MRKKLFLNIGFAVMVQFASFDALASAALFPSEDPSAVRSGFSIRRGLVLGVVAGLLGGSSAAQDTRQLPLCHNDWLKGVDVPDWRIKAGEWCSERFGPGTPKFDLWMDLEECVSPAIIDVLNDYAVRDDKVGIVAKYTLACRYAYNGIHGMKALTLLEDAAGRGFGPAQYTLGTFYRDGAFGGMVPQNKVKAVEWHEKAAMQGCDVGGFVVAAYLTGDSVEKNAKKAVELCQTSRGISTPEAQQVIAGMYAAGDGVPVDPVEAARWSAWADEKGTLELLEEPFSLALRGSVTSH